MNDIDNFLTIDRHHQSLTNSLIFKLGSIDIHEKKEIRKLRRFHKLFVLLKYYIFTIPIMGILFHEQMFIRNPFRQNKWAITHNIFRSCGLISISFNCLLMNRSEGGKTKDTWEKKIGR